MNILILAKDYPPLPVIAAQRPAAWAKYLRKNGHRVRVVTSTPAAEGDDDSDVFRVSTDLSSGPIGSIARLRRKFRSFGEYFLPFLLPGLSRYAPIARRAAKLIEADPPDVMIATAEPYVLFGLTARLSERYSIPWVADYRDVWTSNPRLPEKPLWVRAIVKILGVSAEKRWVSKSEAVTTACRFYAELLRTDRIHERVYPVYNGHDIDFDIPRPARCEVPVFAYAGRLYPFQPIEAVIRGLIKLKAEGLAFELKFFGLADWPDQIARVEEAAGNSGLPLTFLRGQDYRVYIHELAKCDAFILLSRPDRKALAAKVFDYLALNRPIVLYPADGGELEFFIENHHKGTVCRSDEDLLRFLRNIATRSHDGRSEAMNDLMIRKRYARETTVRELESVLVQVCDNRTKE